MLNLQNIEEKISFKAEIVAYQFPEDQHDDWCLLQISVQQGEHLFEQIDPALESPDIVRLYHWFKALADRTLPSHATLRFIEPCIAFSYLSSKKEKVRFSIHLDCELKPTFKLVQLGQLTNG